MKSGGGEKRSNNAKSYHGYVGIENLGFICYMNALMQQFYIIPSLRYGLLSADDREPPTNLAEGDDSIDDNVLHQLQRLMGFLELSSREYYNPHPFCYSFKDEGRPINTAIQQDVQEFLNMLFDRIEDKLKNNSQKYLLKCIFGGKICSQVDLFFNNKFILLSFRSYAKEDVEK
jgi:ubiquitin carboxyl-terminal hydrolase 34